MTDFTIIQQIEALTEQLSAADQLLLIQRISARLHDRLQPEPTFDPDMALTPEEIEALFSIPNTPVSSRELAESEYVGMWRDKGITDSVEWLMEQRRLRREHKSW